MLPSPALPPLLHLFFSLTKNELSKLFTPTILKISFADSINFLITTKPILNSCQKLILVSPTPTSHQRGRAQQAKHKVFKIVYTN